MMLSVIVGDSSEAQNKERLINSVDLIHAGYTF